MINFQKNASSGKLYQGGNQEALQAHKVALGFKSDEWLTFVQAKSKGLNLYKGAHGVRIVKLVEREEASEKNEPKRSYRVPRSYVVFNLDQTYSKEEVERIKQLAESI